MPYTQNGISVTEHGWPAHFICASRCNYRRNTHLTQGERVIVVSSVGCLHYTDDSPIAEIGCGRYYETMIFLGKREGPYVEADVQAEVFGYAEPWGIFADRVDALPTDVENVMDAQHDAIVQNLCEKFDEAYEATLTRLRQESEG